MAYVKFGDIVQEVKINIDRKTDKHEFYIAGEHMESENMHLTKRGRFEGSDVGPAFIRLFKPGQILYGSRRTYLKKVAFADFEGITSNTTFVLESKDENVFLQNLLPFYMLSESFTDFAVKHSKGSTNPYILFSDLAEYEFDLPSIEEQRSLLSLLEACDVAKESYKKLLKATDDLIKSQFIEMFGDPIDNSKGWSVKGLTELGSCKNGMNFSARDQGVTIQSVGVGDIKDYDYIDDIDSLTTLSLNVMPSEEYLLKDGDLVFVRSNGNKNLVGRCIAIYPHEVPVTFSGFCIRFRKESDCILLGYLLRLLKLPEVRAKMAGRGANIQNLNQKILAALQIPIPPLELQQEYVEFVQRSDKSKFVVQECSNRNLSRCSVTPSRTL